MNFNEYQKEAMKTCLPSSNNPLYMLTEISEEVGELNGKFSKAIRKEQIVFEDNQLISKMSSEEYVDWIDLVIKEMGDVLWGLAGMAHVLGIRFEEIAEENLKKLASRQLRNVIHGDGDNR